MDRQVAAGLSEWMSRILEHLGPQGAEDGATGE